MSDKPLLERLQVKGERTLALVDAPAGVVGLETAAKSDAREADVVLVFCADRRRLDGAVPSVADGMKAGAILWVAYPKLTSPLAADLNRNLIHDLAPGWGLDTVAQIAIDADWSALRLKRV